VTTINDGLEKESSLAKLCEPNYVRPDRSLVTIDTELRRLQKNFSYIYVYIYIYICIVINSML